MVKTLNNNYAKNVDILKENIRRGLSQEQALNMINSQEQMFKQANLYNQPEQDYIQALNDVIKVSFIRATALAKSIGINVTEVK